MIYLWRFIPADALKKGLYPIWAFLRGKWFFDELYHVLFVLPAHLFAAAFAALDKLLIDGLINALAGVAKGVSAGLDAVLDRGLIDGTANAIARNTYNLGLTLRGVQVGGLRYYVMFIALFTVVLFIAAAR